MSTNNCPNPADRCFNPSARTDRTLITALRGSAACPTTMPLNGIARQYLIQKHSITTKIDSEKDPSLDPSSRTPDLIRKGAKAEGSIDMSFKAGATDPFLEDLLLNDFSTDVDFDTFTEVEWTGASTLRLKDGDYTPYYANGQTVRTSGFLNEVNNGYRVVASSAFVSPDTIITMTTATSVAEASTARTLVQDTNDVVRLNLTNVAAGTGGASAFDSGGANAFAGLALEAGQSIYVNGLGIETGSIQVAAVDGDTVELSDCKNQIVFEFVTAGTIGEPGNVYVELGADNNANAQALSDAIMEQLGSRALKISSSVTTDTVTLRNLNYVNGSIGVTGASVVTAFTGGDKDASGIFQVVSSTDDVINVTPQPSTVAAGAAVTIQSSVLFDPNYQDIKNTDHSIEHGLTDVNIYRVHQGLKPNTAKIDLPEKTIMTANFEFMGTYETPVKSVPTLVAPNYTVLKPVNTPVMSTSVNISNTLVNGDKEVAAIKDLAINFSRNLGEVSARSDSPYPLGLNPGSLEIGLDMTIYLTDPTYYNRMINWQDLSISFGQGDDLGNYYIFTLPACKVTDAPLDSSGGKNSDIMQAIKLEAYSKNAGKMIFINRFSNIVPV